VRQGKVAVLLSVAVLGCSPATYRMPASLYRHYGDRLRVYFGGFLGQPCGIMDYAERSHLSAGECYVFGASRRMTGVLRTDAYGVSQFFEGRNTLPVTGAEWERGHPTLSDQYRLRKSWSTLHSADEVERTPRTYRVTFVGRETAPYGGRPQQRIVIVDRIEAVRRLPNP
jgi:hypothetical protein